MALEKLLHVSESGQCQVYGYKAVKAATLSFFQLLGYESLLREDLSSPKVQGTEDTTPKITKITTQSVRALAQLGMFLGHWPR